MTPEEAAGMIATRHGVAVETPTLLSNSNHVVLWLKPAPVVAKVSSRQRGRLRRELEVVNHLVSEGAPVVPPSPEFPLEVHQANGFEVTFWAYQPPRNEVPSVEAVAAALFDVHQGLVGYPASLPSYREELLAVADVLDDPLRVRALPDSDRRLLRSALDRLLRELAQHATYERCLHGSPHIGNLLMGDTGVLYFDFEMASVGPVEWDLAHVQAEVVDAYPAPIDHDILGLCRSLASVKTATWCWANFEHPKLSPHARHHLSVVQALFGRASSI